MTDQEQVEIKKGWALVCKNVECMRETFILVKFEAERSPDYCPFCGVSPDRVAFDPNQLMGME